MTLFSVFQFYEEFSEVPQSDLSKLPSSKNVLRNKKRCSKEKDSQILLLLLFQKKGSWLPDCLIKSTNVTKRPEVAVTG